MTDFICKVPAGWRCDFSRILPPDEPWHAVPGIIIAIATVAAIAAGAIVFSYIVKRIWK